MSTGTAAMSSRDMRRRICADHKLVKKATRRGLRAEHRVERAPNELDGNRLVVPIALRAQRREAQQRRTGGERNEQRGLSCRGSTAGTQRDL
jgi:hypothetical protein